jgi:hypothetical protein
MTAINRLITEIRYRNTRNGHLDSDLFVWGKERIVCRNRREWEVIAINRFQWEEETPKHVSCRTGCPCGSSFVADMNASACMDGETQVTHAYGWGDYE